MGKDVDVTVHHGEKPFRNTASLRVVDCGHFRCQHAAHCRQNLIFRNSSAEKIEDYVRTLDPGDRAAFVLNGVETSAFADHLDEDMLKKLRASVLSG